MPPIYLLELTSKTAPNAIAAALIATEPIQPLPPAPTKPRPSKLDAAPVNCTKGAVPFGDPVTCGLDVAVAIEIGIPDGLTTTVVYSVAVAPLPLAVAAAVGTRAPARGICASQPPATWAAGWLVVAVAAEAA